MTSIEPDGIRPAGMGPAGGLLLLLSAPVDPRRYDAAVLPAESYRPAQTLFGFDAQLAGFAAFARQAGQACRFVPAAEIFSPSSAARLLEDREPGARLHLRFGPARHARLLKGVPTLAVLFERPTGAPRLLGRHPFAGGALPAGCAGTVDDDSASSVLQSPAWQRYGGGALPNIRLPAACAVADLPPFDPAGDSAAWPPGFVLRSLADDAPGIWGAIDAPGAGPILGQPVLIPWNLAHDASVVPALLERLARHAAWPDGALTPVLLPFNAVYGLAEPLTGALARLRAACAETALPPSRIFVGRMTEAAGTACLAGRFPLAWVDLSDPEQGFVRRRLAHLGIACAGIGAAAQAPGCAFAIPAEETKTILVDDWFGPRQCDVRLPTLPALTDFVRRTVLFTPTVLPPPAPAEPDAGAFFATLRRVAEGRG